jgi:hypothetical protein
MRLNTEENQNVSEDPTVGTPIKIKQNLTAQSVKRESGPSLTITQNTNRNVQSIDNIQRDGNSSRSVKPVTRTTILKKDDLKDLKLEEISTSHISGNSMRKNVPSWVS